MLAASGFDPEVEMTLTFRFEVRLGALRATWEEGPVTPDATGAVSWPVNIPGEAWLHELAADYVTDLTVHVEGVDPGGARVHGALAPEVWLAWPEGAKGAPVVWDAAALERSAPRGVVSASVRAALVDGGTSRVLAPILASGPVSDDPAEPEDGT